MSPVVLEPTYVTRADAAFWDSFYARDWNRGPVHLRFEEPPLDVGERDVFEAAVTASTEHRERVAGTLVNLYVNGHRRPSDFDHLLPTREDVSFTQYARRVTTALAAPDFGFVLFGCQRFDVSIWRAARAFLAPLFARVGLPSGYTEVDAFSGPYNRTPFGIHKDNAANFSFVMAGAKSMLFWPEASFRNRMPGHPGYLGRGDYEAFADRDGALRIDAQVGDVIYWPSSYWHIAVTDPVHTGPEAWCPTTMNFALYETVAGSSRVADALGAFMGRDPAAHPEPTFPLAAPPDALPTDIANDLAQLRAALARGAVDEQLQDNWLRYVSASGFRSVASIPEPAGVRLDDHVSLTRGSRIVWRQSGHGLTIAANGSLFRCGNITGFTPLLSRLAAGERLSVDATIGTHGERVVLPLLRKLLASDALEATAPAPSVVSGDAACAGLCSTATIGDTYQTV